MNSISLREAIEYGFHIDTLERLLAPTLEESYADPQPAECLRRIARSQDDWSFIQTRNYIRQRLYLRRPQRRYNAEFEGAVDTALAQFYFGEEMSHSHSLAHARQLQDAAENRRLLLQQVQNEVEGEITGLSLTELPSFLGEIITPKYQGDIPSNDFEEMLVVVMANRVQHDQALRTQLNTQSPGQIKALFGRWQKVSDMLTPHARGEAIKIPPAEAFANELIPMKDYSWSTHKKSFTTKTLLVGLVKRAPQDQTLMLEMGLLDSPTCKRLLFRIDRFVGTGDKDTLAGLIAPDLDISTVEGMQTFTERAKTMVGFILKHLS